MKLKFLEKSEKKYITWTALFFLIYFLVAIPWASSYFKSDNYLLEFFWFNLIVIVFLQIFLKSVSTGKKLPKLKGFFGLIFLFMALSIISPPLSVLQSGQIAINDKGGSFMVPAAADAVVGKLWISLGVSNGVTLPSFNLFGLQFIGGFFGFTYILTYIFTPLALLLVSSKLLNDFVNAL